MKIIRERYEITNPEVIAAARGGRKPVGLGDLVAILAHPVAVAFDAIVGTNLKDCGACGQRQARLNQAVPDIRHPLKRSPGLPDSG